MMFGVIFLGANSFFENPLRQSTTFRKPFTGTIKLVECFEKIRAKKNHMKRVFFCFSKPSKRQNISYL
eukprot:UN23270